jgi:hypothetical protein
MCYIEHQFEVRHLAGTRKLSATHIGASKYEFCGIAVDGYFMPFKLR